MMHSDDAGSEWEPAISSWQRTPAWHPYSWFGYTWRRRAEERYDPTWDYTTDADLAKRHLEMEFG